MGKRETRGGRLYSSHMATAANLQRRFAPRGGLGTHPPRETKGSSRRSKGGI